MNLYRSEAFRSKKFSRFSLPNTYVHKIRHFELQLCLTHVTEWSIDDPVEADSDKKKVHTLCAIHFYVRSAGLGGNQTKITESSTVGTVCPHFVICC